MIGIIIQARTGSTRFPRKIYEDLNGKSTLYRVLESCKASTRVDKIILAMPDYDKEEFEGSFVKTLNGAIDHRFSTYFGDPEDLTGRYYNAAVQGGLDIIVRVTGDCPFGGTMVDSMLNEYIDNNYAATNTYLGNNDLVTQDYYSDGLDCEIFTRHMLAEANEKAVTQYDREHCTPYMYRINSEFPIRAYENKKPNPVISTKFSDFSFDTEGDKQVLLKLCKYFDETDTSMSGIDRIKMAIERAGGKPKPTNYLTGERIRLVKFADRHITPAYIAWLNDQEVNRYLCTGRMPVSKDEMVAPKDEKNLMFAIMSNLLPGVGGNYETSGAYQNYVGTCSLHSISNIDRRAEIGYMIGDKSHWGIGIATELVGLLAEYGFGRLNMNKLTAGVVKGNIGSVKALEKNGFKQYCTNPQDYFLDGAYLDAERFYKLQGWT